MTPLGIGLDVVDVERVRVLLERYGDRALGRLLTDAERSYCLAKAFPERHVAARVAAKEAAYKAFAFGEVGYIGWQEFEVTRDVSGRPTLAFHGLAQSTARRLRVASTMVSLTHTATHAAAVVVLLA